MEIFKRITGRGIFFTIPSDDMNLTCTVWRSKQYEGGQYKVYMWVNTKDGSSLKIWKTELVAEDDDSALEEAKSRFLRQLDRLRSKIEQAEEIRTYEKGDLI